MRTALGDTQRRLQISWVSVRLGMPWIKDGRSHHVKKVNNKLGGMTTYDNQQ